MKTHIIIPIADIEKQPKNDGWEYTHNEIISRLSNLTIACPECETIIYDDEQYQCGTCNGGSEIYVLDWLKKQGKQISLDEKDIINNSRVAAVDYNKFENSEELDKFTTGYTKALKDLIDSK